MKKWTFLLTVLMVMAWAHSASAAANVWPSGPKQVTVGQTFNVVILVTGAKDVDTVRLNGSYSQDTLEWRGAQPGGVFQNVSPGTYVDQGKGKYSFGAFTLAQKANGATRFAILTFRAKKVGSGYIQLDGTSRVLSAGEEQIGSVGRLNITIVEAAPPPPPTPYVIKLFSSSHPDTEAWYANGKVVAGWAIEGKPVKTEYIGFDQEPEGPAETKTIVNTANFEPQYDGVWYIHLGVAFTDKTFERRNLRVQIDRVAPRPIYPTTDQTDVTSNILNYLRFGTMDDTSGIAKYDVYLDGTFVTSTLLQAYKLENQLPGTHEAVVKAYDLAGNNVEGKTTYNILAMEKPALPSIWNQIKLLIFILLAILILILLLLWDKRRKRKWYRLKR